ncbi:dsDNA nuclease domain-containing protein, partial [Streptococcus suis]
NTVCLDNVFYIFDNMDLLNPEDSIRGKLIKSFVDIKGEEPQNPNALYRLVVDSVKEKASYEFDSGTYEDVVKNKGITRSEFDKMLNAHKKESKNGINETQEYINNLSFAKRRRYNTALGNILETQQSESLRLIKIKIYNYIVEHEDSLDDIESYLKEISKLFDDDFDVEFTDDMKSVQYIMIYYMYASGGIL